jgi:hypothetical protein
MCGLAPNVVGCAKTILESSCISAITHGKHLFRKLLVESRNITWVGFCVHIRDSDWVDSGCISCEVDTVHQLLIKHLPGTHAWSSHDLSWLSACLRAPTSFRNLLSLTNVVFPSDVQTAPLNSTRPTMKTIKALLLAGVMLTLAPQPSSATGNFLRGSVEGQQR